ncbi:hypothetical protein DFH06DRAFT_190914 [Mycena polygramma]|nr:hypothetical protein DFH06DRAFT_190914 [Mycena polygramma]
MAHKSRMYQQRRIRARIMNVLLVLSGSVLISWEPGAKTRLQGLREHLKPSDRTHAPPSPRGSRRPRAHACSPGSPVRRTAYDIPWPDDASIPRLPRARESLCMGIRGRCQRCVGGGVWGSEMRGGEGKGLGLREKGKKGRERDEEGLGGDGEGRGAESGLNGVGMGKDRGGRRRGPKDKGRRGDSEDKAEMMRKHRRGEGTRIRHRTRSHSSATVFRYRFRSRIVPNRTPRMPRLRMDSSPAAPPSPAARARTRTPSPIAHGQRRHSWQLAHPQSPTAERTHASVVGIVDVASPPPRAHAPPYSARCIVWHLRCPLATSFEFRRGIKGRDIGG